MNKLSSWSLWLGGLLALLGAFGVARLTFNVLFIEMDALPIFVSVICCINAYVLGNRH
jgi:hypothetical protein